AALLYNPAEVGEGVEIRLVPRADVLALRDAFVRRELCQQQAIDDDLAVLGPEAGDERNDVRPDDGRLVCCRLENLRRSSGRGRGRAATYPGRTGQFQTLDERQGTRVLRFEGVRVPGRVAHADPPLSAHTGYGAFSR